MIFCFISAHKVLLMHLECTSTKLPPIHQHDRKFFESRSMSPIVLYASFQMLCIYLAFIQQMSINTKSCRYMSEEDQLCPCPQGPVGLGL